MGHDRLTAQGRKFYAQIDKLQENQVFIGYQQGKAKHKDGDGTEVDMADIAMFNELGTSTSPSRPFLRTTVEKNEEKINQMCEQVAKAIANGGTAEDALKKLGAFGVSLVQETIGSGTFTPNAPSTIKAKGSDKPLIDTGQMRQSVHYVIKSKGGG